MDSKPDVSLGPIPNVADNAHFLSLSFFLLDSRRGTENPTGQMSAFNIRKQSPNQGGNTESPPFPAPGALQAEALLLSRPLRVPGAAPSRAVAGGRSRPP